MIARISLVALLCACLLVASAGRAQVAATVTPVTDAMLETPDPGDWLSWRRTLDGHGHSPLDQITTDNAHTIRLVWSWAMDQGSQQTTPLVHDGVMYLANPGETVQALDAATGELLWEYRRGAVPPGSSMGGPPPGGIHRNIAMYMDKIYLNTVDAHVIALDARTGRTVWDTDVGGGAGFHGARNEVVAVKIGTVDGDKKIVFCHSAAIDGHAMRHPFGGRLTPRGRGCAG